MPPVTKVFELIGLAAVATSADEARDMQVLRDGDGISMNKNRLLADAKALALRMVDNYMPPEPREAVLPGPAGQVALDMAIDGFRTSGKATPHDVVVSKALAKVLTGGSTDLTETISEQGLLDIERSTFLWLAKQKNSKARISHMLKTGKPLRN